MPTVAVCLTFGPDKESLPILASGSNTVSRSRKKPNASPFACQRFRPQQFIGMNLARNDCPFIMEIPMKLALLSVGAMFSLPVYGGAEAGRSPITVHVLDTSRGKPAAEVAVMLEQADGKQWRELAKAKTNGDGRVETLLPKSKPLAAGIYRATFESGAYFAKSKTKTFYPRIIVLFEVVDPKEHYHIPLLLSPFGYSTYRGN